MTDLDQLEKDIEAYHWIDVASEELLRELVSRLRKSEKDAERYQWLRQYTVDSYLAKGSLEALDHEIDASMIRETSHDRP